MPHIKDDKYPYTDWKVDFPLTSFPTPRDGIDFPEHGIYWVHPTEPPEYDPETEQVVEGQPEQVEGQWRQTWTVEPLPPEPVPQAVTMRQARLALLQIGKLAAVDTAIDSLPDPDKSAARIEWEYSQEVQRDKPFVSMLAPALGLTEEDLDNLFVLASTL